MISASRTIKSMDKRMKIIMLYNIVILIVYLFQPMADIHARNMTSLLSALLSTFPTLLGLICR